MAVWGIYNESEKPKLRRENVVRAASAALIALGLHLLLFKLMMFKTPAPFEVVEDFIAIELVKLPPMAQTVEASPEDPLDITETPLAPPPPKIKPATITPAANEQRIDDGLKSLAAELTCLKGFWKIAAPAKGDAFARSGEGGSSGRLGAIKDCPDYLPAAKEDRDRRNKFQARLKANEARRNDEGQP